MNIMKRIDLVAGAFVVALVLVVAAAVGIVTYGITCLYLNATGQPVDGIYLPIIMILSFSIGGIMLLGAWVTNWFDTKQRLLEKGRSIHAGRIKSIRKAFGVLNDVLAIPGIIAFLAPPSLLVDIIRLVIVCSLVVMACAYVWLVSVIKREGRFIDIKNKNTSGEYHVAIE